MTIHKSKGLQFDHVILPRLDGAPRRKDERLLLWLENGGPRQDAFIIAPLRERGSAVDPTYRYVQQLLAEKEEHEYTRLLYVAATRARRRLFLTATLRVKEESEGELQVQKPRARSFLEALWPIYEKEAAAGCVTYTVAAPDAVSVVQTRALRRLRDDWQAPPRPEPLRVRQGNEEEVAVHRLLAEIGHRGMAWWTRCSDRQRSTLVLRVLRRLGRVENEDDVVAAAVRAIDGALEDPMGRWLLSPHADAHSEWEITGKIDGRIETVILDRTFLDGDGTRWIIDYKSAVHEGAGVDAFLDAQLRLHSAQLQRYSVMMKAYDARPQRLLLYFPILQAWRELLEPDQGALPPSS